jgi:hypothetical protein
VAGLQTEFPFTLPKGYVDGDGMLHRYGVMRLATARDEIEPLRDPRVSGPDDPYLTIIVLSRVITELGTLRQVSTRDVENLFAADLAFLQDLYGIINFGDADDVAALRAALVDETIDQNLDQSRDQYVDEPEHVDADDVAVVGQTGSEGDGDVDLAPAEPARRRDRIEEVSSRRSE